MSGTAVIDNSPLDMDAVPPHIKRRSERASKMLDLVQQGKDPNDPRSWDEAPPADAPQAAQEPRTQEPRPQSTEPPANPPPAAQEPPKAQEQPSTQEHSATDTSDPWEQRYRSLEGQFRGYREALARANAENDQLRRTVTEMERNQGQAQSANKLPGGQVSADDIKKLFTEEEQEAWGPEWFAAQERVLQNFMAPLQRQVAELSQQTGNIVEKDMTTARQNMIDTIAAAGIDFDKLNRDDQEFFDWAREMDLGAGKLRKTLIEEAWHANQGNRVVHLVRQFERDARRTSPEARPSGGNGQAKPSRAKTLEELAAPGKGKTVAPPATAGDEGTPKTIPLSEYVAFQKDKAMKRLRLTSQQIADRSAELDRAYSEGRIDLNA